jgi:hypothetical protein
MKFLEKITFFYLLIFLGILIRIISLFTKGMEDVDVMINWGYSIDQNGWNAGYKAIYFPTSHSIFYFIVKISQLLTIDVFLIFTYFRFIVEILILFTLLFLFKFQVINKFTLVFIWLNPLFIVLSLSGYTDNFSILFFLVIILIFSIFAQTKNKSYLFLGSYTLSLFIFLKPQTLILSVFMIFFTSVFIIFTKKLKITFLEILIIFSPILIIIIFFSGLLSSEKKLDCAGQLGPITISSLNNPNSVEWNVCIKKELVGIKYPSTGPEICILQNYEAFAPIGSAGYCIKKYQYFNPKYVNDYFSTGFEILKNQVINGTAEHMPSYSANMPNMWHIYVINFLNYDTSKEVWFYKATNSFNKNVLYINLFIILFLTVIFLFINKKLIDNWLSILIFSGFFITFNIPLFSTLAHENHLALGILMSIFLIYILRKSNYIINNFLIFIFSTLLAINISNLYLLPLWSESNLVFLNSINTLFTTLFKFFDINIISYLVTALSLVFLCSIFITSLKVKKLSN